MEMILRAHEVVVERPYALARHLGHAGLAHPRQNGKRPGRPATVAAHATEIRRLDRAGLSRSAIARQLNIGRTSVRRILREGSEALAE